MNKTERQNQEFSIWKIYEGVSLMMNKSISESLQMKKVNYKNMVFNYDRCFGQKSSNEDIYQTMVQNPVMSCLKGINATVFMYG